jgi:NAD(P)-dependent dehydrogenase (short-subunit alcohol dehydrogenase family)
MQVEPSLVAADLFSKRSVPCLVLTGSQAVRDGTTAWAKSYGMCKSAVHHLAESVASEKSNIANRRVVCLLPTMLDTPANRKSMPDADFTKWTPTDVLAGLVLELCKGGTPKGYSASTVYYRV